MEVVEDKAFDMVVVVDSKVVGSLVVGSLVVGIHTAVDRGCIHMAVVGIG